ncbi:MAG TPA: chemotaxis protein CheB, partial [Burkholderiales bacterium]|nr:chemotaxis protein CheB [Burkholderiales bacterium]
LLHAPPRDTGMAYILVSHLPPSRESMLTKILARASSMPVIEARDHLKIEHNHTTRYFAPAPGRASLNLLKMVREEFVMGVRAADQAARTQEMPARQNGLRLKFEDRECAVDVEVIPVRTGLQRAELFMVIFEDASSRSALGRGARRRACRCIRRSHA